MSIDPESNLPPQLSIEGYTEESETDELSSIGLSVEKIPTAAQIEALDVMSSEGMRIHQVANHLRVPRTTVDGRLQGLFRRLDVDTASAALVALFNQGLLKPVAEFETRPKLTITPRQGEIVNLFMQGLSDGEIAAHLHISKNQVRNTIGEIARSNEASRLKLLRYCLQVGFEIKKPDATTFLDPNIEQPAIRYGMYPDWARELLISFPNRSFAFEDLAKFLWGEKYSELTKAELVGLAHNFINSAFGSYSSKRAKDLFDKGLRLTTLTIPRSGYHQSSVRLYVLPLDEEVPRVEDFDENSRITDGELKEFALTTRSNEIRKQLETEWEQVESASRSEEYLEKQKRKKQAEIERTWATYSRREREMRKAIIIQKQTEVSEWKEDERLYLQQQKKRKSRPKGLKLKEVLNELRQLQIENDAIPGFPAGFIERIEELETKLSYPPPREVLESEEYKRNHSWGSWDNERWREKWKEAFGEDKK